MTQKPNLTIQDYARIDPHVTIDVDGHTIAFSTPNAKTVWRAKTIMEKEPVTIEWIRTFKKGEVLVDVGANVGMYTIISAATRGTQVFAFEPEAQNFALLIKNIIRNRLSDRVVAWPVALFDERKFGRLFLSGFDAGRSCHTFDEPVNFKLEAERFPHQQGSVSATLDELVADGVLPVPTHIKIDVDGFEHKVLRGSAQTLSNPALRTLLIEFNPQLVEHRKAIGELHKLGFECDPGQVERSRRPDGRFEGLAEHVFRR